MDFQWYPGHMTRAKREMEEDLKLIDLVIELLDARAPKSSRNPDIDKLAKGKSRLILLNKADLADPSATEAWVEYLSGCGATEPSGDNRLPGCGVNIPVVALDSRGRASMKAIDAAVRKACAKKIERDLRRGIKNRPVRAMVVGIPNVGKSTFINSYAKRAAAKTGNKPGVTKGRQWIRLSGALELLDTPGILWPKFEDQKVGLNLALLGSIRDEIIDSEELALELIKVLAGLYPGVVEGFYGISGESGVLQEIARARGCLIKGGELDTARAARLLLDDFRGGRLGRITLERP